MEEHDEPMDEFQWEEFMKKSDEIADKLSKLMEQHLDDPNLDDIIAREMGWEKVSEDDGIERPWLDEMDEAIEEMMDDERSEEWKRTAGLSDGTDRERDRLEQDPLYVMGRSFTFESMRWCESLTDEVKDDAEIRTVMEHLMIPAVKIAGAMGVDGDAEAEKEILGLRLANYKRGLQAANTVLNGLSAVNAKGLVVSESIFPVIKQATELRNAIAVRILEVRERFNSL
ncbi:MAG: hypothetical protein ACOYNS_17335 [Bacteroidota bacterium]